MTAKTISFFFLITLLLCVCGNAQRRGVSSGTTRSDLQSERVGHESSKFLAVVGNWSIVEDNSGKKVLAVDGRSWLRGQPAGSLAEKARSIYGSRNEEFIDNVKAWAYFPYAVAKDISDFHDGDISIRFKTTSCSGRSIRACASSSRRVQRIFTWRGTNGTRCKSRFTELICRRL